MQKVDTLIIGSGVAGAAISQKILSDNPQASILMLEAGTRVKMKDFGKFQQYILNGSLPYTWCQDEDYPDRDEHKAGENASTGGTKMPLQGSRLMIYGGSTVHWGGWSFRLKPEDFRLKSNTNKSNSIDWPIDYKELEPYYCESEHYIGVSGDGDSGVVDRSGPYPYRAFPYTAEDGIVIKAMDKVNINYNHLPIARHGISGSESSHAPCQTTGACKYCPFGARYVAANYLDDMKRLNAYPNFVIQMGCVVEEILMDNAEHAKGVRYFDKNTNKRVEVEANLVVVAAGAIESAKLLLRSKSKGHENGIGNQHQLVGRNLVTHPYFIFEAILPENPDRLQPEMNFPTLVSRHFDSEAEQAKGKFIIINSPSSPVVQLGSWMQEGMSRADINKKLKGRQKIQLHGIMEVFSEPENRVQNLDKVNHIGLPETIVHFTKAKGFDDRLAEIKEHITTIFHEMGVKEDVILKMLSWRADHAGCLTRMSDSPETGVVDKDLKVFGVDNLYVCSNSSFSSMGAVNPTLTLGALSLRLGDHLIQKFEKQQ